MSRPNLTIVPPTELVSYTTTDYTDAPLSPGTPMSPASRRRHESTWDRIQRLKREAEAFHQRRRASSATEPPMSLTDLQEEVEQIRIKEEEEDKLAEQEEKAEEARKKQEEIKKQEEEKRKVEEDTDSKESPVKKRPPTLIVTPDASIEAPKTPKTPLTPKSPRSPFKVVTSEPAEVTDDLKMLWGELRKQKTELLWVLLGFPDTKSRKVIIRGIGTAKEGIEDLKKKLEVKAVQFGALRAIGIDEHARRPKFVGFALVGSQLTPSQKLQAMHAKEIQRDLFTGIHVTMEFTTGQDLELHISKKLATLEKSVTSFDFGGKLIVKTSSLTP